MSKKASTEISLSHITDAPYIADWTKDRDLFLVYDNMDWSTPLLVNITSSGVAKLVEKITLPDIGTVFRSGSLDPASQTLILWSEGADSTTEADNVSYFYDYGNKQGFTSPVGWIFFGEGDGYSMLEGYERPTFARDASGNYTMLLMNPQAEVIDWWTFKPATAGQ
jgi:hypothetical protein